MAKSLDISSKAFIPSKKANRDSGLSPSFNYEGITTSPGAVDMGNLSSYELALKSQGAGEENGGNVDFRVTGRLKFFNEG